MKQKAVLCVLFFAVLAALLFAAPAAVTACPGCKESLFDPGQLAQKLSSARGYALSIALLLSVPFVLVGGLAWAIVSSVRRR